MSCACGRNFEVQAGQAGATLKCDCGGEVRVPSVSKLRELAGKAAYEVGVIDQINGMIDRGELPAGGICAVSGKSTSDVMDICVHAEKFQKPQEFILQHFAPVAFLMLFQPSLTFGRRHRPRGDGRDTWVRTPLFVDSKSQDKFRQASQKKRQRWLRSVPVYAKLLDDYPQATVELVQGS